MENVWLTGLLVPGVLFAWGGISLHKRAKKRGVPAGCACLLCFLCAAVCAMGALKGICEVAPLEFFGLFFGGTGGTLWWRERRFFKRAIMVPGVVTSYEQKRGKQNSTLYTPVVQFEFDGQTRRAAGTLYSSGKPKPGTPMKVGVNPRDITDARVFQRASLVMSGVFFVTGMIVLCAAVYARMGGNY